MEITMEIPMILPLIPGQKKNTSSDAFFRPVTQVHGVPSGFGPSTSSPALKIWMALGPAKVGKCWENHRKIHGRSQWIWWEIISNHHDLYWMARNWGRLSFETKPRAANTKGIARDRQIRLWSYTVLYRFLEWDTFQVFWQCWANQLQPENMET